MKIDFIYSKKMTDVREIVFNMRDADMDGKMMAAKYEFFQKKNGFAEEKNAQSYEELSANTKNAFRKHFVYELDSELTITVDEFRELLHFLNYTCVDQHQNYHDNLPRFRRFIFEHRENFQLTRETILIHHNPFYIFGRDDGLHDLINMYCVVLGIDIATRWKDKYIIFKSKENDPLCAYLCGFCLAHGVGIIMNKEDALAIHLKNWNENRYTPILSCYISIKADLKQEADKKLRDDFCREVEISKPARLYYKLAYRFYNGTAGFVENRVEAVRLWKKGWEQNRDYNCLGEYADCVAKGIGCTANSAEAQLLIATYNSLIE